MSNDRRQSDRHATEPLDVITLRTDDGVEYLCAVQDVSRKGFRAEILGGPMHVAPDLGISVHITDCPSSMTDLLCSSTGRIAWTTINAMGIELHEETAEDDPKLKELLEARRLSKWSEWDT